MTCHVCHKPLTRSGAKYCSSRCMGDGHASNPLRVKAARENLAKGRASQRRAYWARAIQRVKRSELVAVKALASQPSVEADKLLTKLLLNVEARGYRRGWCARDKRRAA